MAMLASAFGLDDAPGWRRTIERAIMTRPLSGIGEAIDAIARSTGSRLKDDRSRHDLVLQWGAACNANSLYPDVLAALGALRTARRPAAGFRLGLLSNTQSFDLDFLRREGLVTMMDGICLSCDCGLLKPDPAIFRLAAERMGLPPGKVLMVGDRPDDDIEGALGAGMSAVLLDRSRVVSGGDPGTGVPVIDSLSSLPALLGLPDGLISSS